MCVWVYIYIHTLTHTYREKEREREGGKGGELVIYKPHGNPKPKLYNRYTQRERNPNITLKIVNKSQGK